VRADGRVEVLAVTGTLFGVEADPRCHDLEVALEPGDTLVL
jgi:serine phosphatase RsbU (regulator of sigma subunit)